MDAMSDAKSLPPRVSDPPAGRPVLVYDGDCAFCQARVDGWRERTGARVDYLPYQRLEGRFPELPRELFEHTVVRVAPDGTWTKSGEATMRVLADGGSRLPLALYRRLPGAAPLVELGYRFVARNRHAISRVTGDRCRMERDER